MTIAPLEPDVAAPVAMPQAARGFGALVDAAGDALGAAEAAERAFAAHRGGLQEMVVERARADIALAIAAAAAQRAVQGVQTLLGMAI